MSRNYHDFAALYDYLMEAAPYPKWVEVVEEAVSDRMSAERCILELGAGTGTLAELLLKKGYQLTVSDFSEEMLAVADQKLRPLDPSIPLYQLDMRDFDLDRKFDAIIIFCDAINYLKDQEELLSTFKNVYNHLNQNGVLLFDAHSTTKIQSFIAQQTFGSSEPEISYLWECFPGEANESVVHELTFFIENDNGYYSRVEETHEQRTYPLKEFLELLTKAGFQSTKVIGDFDPAKNLEVSERWIFKAYK